MGTYGRTLGFTDSKRQKASRHHGKPFNQRRKSDIATECYHATSSVIYCCGLSAPAMGSGGAAQHQKQFCGITPRLRAAADTKSIQVCYTLHGERAGLGSSPSTSLYTQTLKHATKWLIQKRDRYFYAWAAWSFQDLEDSANWDYHRHCTKLEKSASEKVRR